jgi:hypothetical protein
MPSRSIAARCARAGCLLAAIAILMPPVPAADSASAKMFGGARIQEIYRIRLDRDDLVLESINAAIKKYDIQDGAVLTGLGSVQECTYHGVKSLAAIAQDQVVTVKGPFEMLNLNGIIAAGEPHLHVTLANMKRGAFGGHLENGCKVLYRLELTIAKFSGTPLARKVNPQGIPALQEK